MEASSSLLALPAALPVALLGALRACSVRKPFGALTLSGVFLVACARRHEDVAPTHWAAASARGPQRASFDASPPNSAPPARVVASSPESDASLLEAPGLPDVPTDWCLDGWRGLDEGTCWWMPDARERPTRLLIYLSGIVPPVPRSPQKEKVQRIVMEAARRAGAAVILPRGRRGIGPRDAKDWWAWPTSAADHAAHADAMVRAWTNARATLERAMGRPFARVYLAGSSSGAYFLTALAFAHALDVDGYAATSGGAPGLRAFAGSSEAGVMAPFYVGYATGDPTSGGPKALGAYLTAAGWPVRVREHPGGHGAREEYLDEAFAFWRGSEPLDAGR